MIERVEVAVPGARLAATISGVGEPAALLIHGTSPAAWGDLPARLSGSCRVVAYDRRAFMDSTGAAGGGLTQHAEDAAAVIDTLGLARAIVVGWSIGGVIALELALRRGGLVAGLVLLEPPFLAKRHPSVRMVRAIMGAKLRSALLRSPDAGAERFLGWALWRRDGDGDLERVGRGDVSRCARAIVCELDGGTGEHLSRDGLGALDVPTVVVRGTESTPELAAAAERVQALVPGAELVDAAGSGHLVALDAPEVVSAAVARAAARL